MNREIKFRMWDKEIEMMIVDMDLQSIIGTDINFNSETENYCIMQYTGLKDKNGKEIYEGDIIKYKEWFVKAEAEYNLVEFISGGFVIFLNGDYSVEPKNCEVVGNIYENPELIERGDK